MSTSPKCSVGRTGKGVQNGGGYKTRKGKAGENETKEGPRTGVRTSGKTINTPDWPNLHRTGPGKNIYKEEPKLARSLSLLPACRGAHRFVSLDKRALAP